MTGEIAVDFKKRLVVTEDGRVYRFTKNSWDPEYIHVALLYDPQGFLAIMTPQKTRRPDLFKQLKEGQK